MGNEILDKILNYLTYTKERCSVKELHQKLVESGEDVSFATVLKWTEVGIASGKIIEKNYGNVRIVWVEGKTNG